MSSGFLYVLMNPSMPGLVKVGKTTRDPSTRVSELSAATGVPTAFVLVYCQPVVDCHAAETWVHAELERRGHRPNASREFFTAPAHEAVEVVHAAKAISNREVAVDSEVASEDEPMVPVLESADALFQQGQLFRHGSDDVLVDGARALKLFEQAAGLGHLEAAYCAGTLYVTGAGGARRNLLKATSMHQKAVTGGYWRSHASLAMIFEMAGQFTAAERKWQLLFETAIEEIPKGTLEQVERDIQAFAEDAFTYCERIFSSRIRSPCTPIQIHAVVPPSHLAVYREAVLAFAELKSIETRARHSFLKNHPAHDVLREQLALADAAETEDRVAIHLPLRASDPDGAAVDLNPPAMQ